MSFRISDLELEQFAGGYVLYGTHRTTGEIWIRVREEVGIYGTKHAAAFINNHEDCAFEVDVVYGDPILEIVGWRRATEDEKEKLIELRHEVASQYEIDRQRKIREAKELLRAEGELD